MKKGRRTGGMRYKRAVSDAIREGQWEYVRSRLKAVTQARYFLASRLELFGAYKSFDSLLKSIDLADSELSRIEGYLKSHVLKEIGHQELEMKLEDARVYFYDELINGCRPNDLRDGDNVASDVSNLMQQLWSEVVGVLETLHDALKSTCDSDEIGIPKWLRNFNHKERHKYGKDHGGHLQIHAELTGIKNEAGAPLGTVDSGVKRIALSGGQLHTGPDAKDQ